MYNIDDVLVGTRIQYTTHPQTQNAKINAYFIENVT